MDDLRWKTATIVVTVIAALEFVALAGAAVAILGNPLAGQFGTAAAKAARSHTHVLRTKPLPTKPTLTRSQTRVMVLNGNGRAGAAATTAAQLRGLGYRIGKVGNATSMGYPRSIVMYREGFAAEATRLAHDLRVAVVSPLDGMRAAQLRGAHLVLIVGS
jgi:LytR cell envelope-related transcriptional attenuator